MCLSGSVIPVVKGRLGIFGFCDHDVETMIGESLPETYEDQLLCLSVSTWLVTNEFAGNNYSGPGGGNIPCHLHDFWTLFRAPAVNRPLKRRGNLFIFRYYVCDLHRGLSLGILIY